MVVENLEFHVKRTGNAAAGGINNTAKAMRNLGKASTNASKHTNQLLSSLKRIAMYRILRTIIKEIGKAFSEGLKNVYEFSSTINGKLSQALDSIASKGMQMRNQLGSALGELIMNLQPLIEGFMSLVYKLANALSQLFAVLGGRSTYNKAVESSEKWAQSTKSGAKAAKEWRNQLLGFDEINKLTDQRDTGGGSGSNDSIGAWKETDVADWAKRLKELFSQGEFAEAGQYIANMLNDMVDGIPWHNIGKKIGYYLNAAFTFAAEFIKTFNWRKLGEDIGYLIDNVIYNVDWKNLGIILVGKLWALGNIVAGLLDTVDWSAVTDAVLDVLEGIITGVDWLKLATDLAEGLAGAIGEIAGRINKRLYDYVQEHFVDVDGDGNISWSEIGFNIILGIMKGVEWAVTKFPTWVKEHIWYPFRDAFKTAFGIHSPSTEMASFGEMLIEGLLNGITEKWEEFKTNVKQKWEDFKTWWSGLSLPQFHINMPHLSVDWIPADSLIARFFGVTALPSLKVQWYAKGGFPDAGELYMAREAGPELVGSIGNRNAVMNNDQIVEAVANGVAEAVGSVMGGQNSQPISVKVYLDSKEIRSGQQRLARATGSA